MIVISTLEGLGIWCVVCHHTDDVLRYRVYKIISAPHPRGLLGPDLREKSKEKNP